MSEKNERRRWRWPPDETRAALRAIARVSSRVTAVGLFALVALSAALNLATTVLVGIVVGAVPAAARAGSGTPQAQQLWRLVTLFAVALVAGQVLGRITALADRRLRLAVNQRAAHRLLSFAQGPDGIAHLEAPAFADELTLLRGEMTRTDPGAVVTGLISTFGTRAFGLGAALVVAAWSWWQAVLLVAGALVVYRWLHDISFSLVKGWIRDATHLRRSAYLRDLTLTPPSAKEVRVFGLSGWLVSQFSEAWHEVMQPAWDERRTRTARSWTVLVALAVPTAIVAISAGQAVMAGRLELGPALAVIQAAVAVGSIAVVGNPQLFGAAGATILLRLEGLGEHVAVRDASLTSGGRDPARGPHRELALEHVTFTYPGASRPALHDVTLRIPAGSSIAIVGENGAGKTTLVKLLCRLYDVGAGAITVDGVDVRELDLEAWRTRIAAIFQDFTRFELSLRDNVAWGAGPIDDDLVVDTLERAGARGLVDTLTEGLDTVLSRGYEGGGQLSGGQWQRVALARALYAARDGGVLILDEPTANLDVRAEAELYDRFLDVTSGLTTILISHRFSTVRHADRIVVLGEDGIVEDGSHDELAALGGRYAKMFALQAERYTDDGATVAASEAGVEP
ncbi:MAG TPA: ABC transporter ATP-binding protein [Nitriliruptorales bacterium]